jgi:hypothetical protein
MEIVRSAWTRLGSLPGLPFVIGFPVVVLTLPMISDEPSLGVFVIAVAILAAHCFARPAMRWQTAQLAAAPMVTAGFGAGFGLPLWVSYLLIPVCVVLYQRWERQPELDEY